MAKSKLRESARGRDCTVRVPFVCQNDKATTILAHLNGGGMALKSSDIHGAYCCADCHRWLDGEFVHDSNCKGTWQRNLYHYDAMIETQLIMLSEGLITIE